MRRLMLLAMCVGLRFVVGGAAMAADRAADDLLAKGRSELNAGRAEEALALADRAVELEAARADAHFLRAMALEQLERHQDAAEAYGRVIQLEPRNADAYDHRGSERFKLGQIDESIADFDRAIELVPQRERQHWKRGISYYYAGEYDKGRLQFEAYQTFDDNDVENAVWRYLCMARSEGVDEARRSLLRIRDDPRVPMMQVYELYAGRVMPDDVLAAARAGQPSETELNQRLFYAHLYLGLYYEAAGDPVRAREHLALAAGKHRVCHYMWHVARVHASRLEDER